MFREAERALHEKLVRGQITAYRDEGTRVIAADLEGWPKPDKIGRHIPDIIAERGGQRIYNECETCETIGLDQTRAQYEDFSRAGILEVTVPESCLGDAERYAIMWGIKVNQWWHVPGV
ncbi:MAG: hypothetical protein ACE5QW_09440 [Thermoplasmata archaeon]